MNQPSRVKRALLGTKALRNEICKIYSDERFSKPFMDGYLLGVQHSEEVIINELLE